ncbi:nucleobase:cation symporter-2 family protein, partial [Marinovum sp. F03]
VSNVTPAIIVAGAAGFGFGSGSADFPELLYLIQMSMLFAGVATLLQTITLGPVGAALPIVQGTSFAFLPIMIPLVAGKGVDGLAALFGGVIVGGIFHAFIGTFVGKLRFALPPLVTGLVVTMIGLALVKVGIQYAAGGVPAIGTPEYGSLLNWSAAIVVIVVTLGLKFFTKGMLSISAVLIGLIVGYVYAIAVGMLSLDAITGSWANSAAFALPQPFKYGFEFSIAAVIGFCLMAFISAIETVGDVSGITKGGAGREATAEEVTGATYADGFGTALAGIFGGFPNTSFSQNVGLIAMTGVMSRHVVTCGAIFLIICGLVPKVGGVIRTVPIEVLGGGVIVMFGMVVAAGISMLSDVHWNRRNMVIFAISLSLGLGLQLEPGALQHLPETARVLLTSGLLPAAFLAIVLNLVLPEELTDESTEEVSGGMSGHGEGSYAKDSRA